MYAIHELQGLDYLLKTITKEQSYALYQRNLKLVVELNNSYWYGDFVEMENEFVKQLYIDHLGDVDIEYQHPIKYGTTLLKKVFETFRTTLEEMPKSQFDYNPFHNLDNLPLLFETIVKVLNKANITDVSTSLRPYMLNAHKIDSKQSLPFINLKDERINLVSIIDITD
ncbi:hypothetical protein ABNF65_16950 [Paenibacillus larvae]